MPVALAFNTHPDDDLGVNLPVEVTFASYQTFSGMLAPSRIRSFLAEFASPRTFPVTATSANNGLASSDFLVP